VPDLFDPLPLGGLTLPNRVTMAPLTRQRAGEDGVPGDLHVEYYRQRASAGLIVSEGVFPTVDSRAFPGQPGLEDEAQQAGWARVADAVHEAGGRIFVQIMHGGRMCHPDLLRGAEPVAPSAIAPGVPVRGFSGKTDGPVPRALETEELPGIAAAFASAARRAVDAGADGVEVHGANGYLLHEFTAASSNHRTDAYGGSPENRARLTVEVVRAVAAEIGAERTALRLSPEHDVQGVLEHDRADVLATYGAILDGVADLDLACLSLLHRDVAGDLVAALRARFGGPVLLNSGFSEVTGAAEARRIVEEGLADAAVVGRSLIANPDLVRRWREDRELNAPDPSTFYVGGAHGYTDYPSLEG